MAGGQRATTRERSGIASAVFVLGMALGGCLRATTYACESDVQCRHPERAGACTDLGWCAYMAPGCDSGWQYSMHAEEPIAGMCVPVGEEPLDGTSDGDASSDEGEPPLPSACEDECTTPPGDCWAAGSGRCEDGTCVFDPVSAGESCETDCEAGGFCDASGTCVCATSDASSSGGASEDCELVCIVGEHATAASCDDAGTCIVTCESPWENCDGDPANGCEVPVGVAHVCDSGGINLDGGCWSAYCGQSDAAGATNFGTYYCMDCATCTEPAAGQCHWCDHDTGNFFPTGSCVCGAEFIDAVCAG